MRKSLYIKPIFMLVFFASMILPELASASCWNYWANYPPRPCPATDMERLRNDMLNLAMAKNVTKNYENWEKNAKEKNEKIDDWIVALRHRLNQFEANIGTKDKEWKPKVDQDHDRFEKGDGEASEEYKKYLANVEKKYGKTWEAKKFGNQADDKVYSAHLARTDKESGYIDARVRQIMQKRLPQLDTHTRDILKQYSSVTKDCVATDDMAKNGSNNNVSDNKFNYDHKNLKQPCLQSNQDQGNIEARLAKLNYRKQMAEMLAMMVQMRMLNQRRMLEQYKRFADKPEDLKEKYHGKKEE